MVLKCLTDIAAKKGQPSAGQPAARAGKGKKTTEGTADEKQQSQQKKGKREHKKTMGLSFHCYMHSLNTKVQY